MNRIIPLIISIMLSWALFRLGEQFWEPTVFAGALSVAFWPCKKWMLKRTSRRVSSLVTSVVLMIGLAIPACWAWSSSFNELDHMFKKEAKLQINTNQDGQSRIKQWGVRAALDVQKSAAWSAQAKKAESIPWGSLALTAIELYFMLADGARCKEWFELRARQRGGEQGSLAWSRACEAFNATVKSCLWFGMFSFVILWGLFYVAGASSPLAFAVASACASMLPFVAPVMVACIAVALFGSGNIWGPAVLMVLGAGGLGLINNVLRPKWVSKESRLPMPIALIGMAGGAMSWGAAGLLVGPALLAGAISLAEGDGEIKGK